jgi:hypothetical protein
VKISTVAHASSVSVRDEPEPSEVDLALAPRWRVVDANCRLASSSPTAFHREARQCAVGHIDAFASQQDADLHDGEAVVVPGLDLLLFVDEPPPALTMAAQAMQADAFADLADQLVGELFLIT